MRGKGIKIIYPLIHAYILSKKYNKSVSGMTKDGTRLLKSLLKNGWIENLKEVWQLCVVSLNHLFAGEKPDETIRIPYIRDIISPLEKLKGVKTTPFWIEIFCNNTDKTSCIDRIFRYIEKKGVVSVYGEKELLEEIKSILQNDFSVALDKFIAYDFKIDKLKKFKESFRMEWKNIGVYFNPFKTEFFPLK